MITTQIFEADIEPLLHRGQVLIGGAYHTRDNGMKAKIDRRILWCIRHATASLPTDRMWTAVHIWTTRSGCGTLELLRESFSPFLTLSKSELRGRTPLVFAIFPVLSLPIASVKLKCTFVSMLVSS